MDKPHYDPLAELAVMRDVVRELAQHGPFDPRTTPPAALASLLIPIDILDLGAAIAIQANLPGVNEDEVSVEIKGDMLTLSARTKTDPDVEGAVYLRRERQIARLTRSVPLPVHVQAENTSASFKNGVLTVKLPKIASTVPKSVKIKTT